MRRVDGRWREILVGWGGALNVAGLCTIALVPENVDVSIHNVGCYLANFGGAAILVARLRKWADLAWMVWFVVIITIFALCIDLKAIPFSPWVPSMQKLLIVSFAVWAGWIAWRMAKNDSLLQNRCHYCILCMTGLTMERHTGMFFGREEK